MSAADLLTPQDDPANGDCLQGLVRNPVERPILFNGAMVRAILAGRKTQTRRVVKPEPVGLNSMEARTKNEFVEIVFRELEKRCPYGLPGDRLWVRETFAWRDQWQSGIIYAADGKTHGRTLHPSIFMPRTASRITLQILAVRVKRLQSMARTEARDEGCGTEDVPWRATGRTGHGWTDTYAELWDSINLKRGHGWDSNPWVWVIDFARISNSNSPTKKGD